MKSKLTPQEWRIFKRRNIAKTVELVKWHGMLKEQYLRRFWWLKWRFNDKSIAFFEKLKVRATRKVSVPTMDFNITTRCTLQCKDCGSLMPLYKKEQHFDEEFESFKARLNALLSGVCHIYQLKLIGGEPLLNKNLPRMVDYACGKRQVLMVEIITNGTIIPSDELLAALKRNKNAIVYISNYTANPNIKILKYEQVLDILDKNGIAHYTQRKADDFQWHQRTGIFPRHRDKAGIKKEFENCWQRDCVSYCEGKFLVCTRAYYIQKALNPEIAKEGVELDLLADNMGGGGGTCRLNLPSFTPASILRRAITALLTTNTLCLLACRWAIKDTK